MNNSGEGYISLIRRSKELGWLDMTALRPCYNCDDVYSKQNMAYIEDKKGYLCTNCVNIKTVESLK